MAKDSRHIVRGVRINGTVYRDGQEEELAAALSAKDGQRLIDSGSLEGDWEFSGHAPKTAAKAAGKASDGTGEIKTKTTA